MDFIKRNINKTQRNGVIVVGNYISSSIGGSSIGGGSSVSGNYLPATSNNDGTYTVDLDTVYFKGHIISDGEVSAYGSGATVDTEINLENYYTKDQIDGMFDTMGGGNVDVDLSDYYTKDQTDTKLSSYVTTTALNNHTGSTAHITSTERTNWNAAYNNNHTHSNKTVLDGISSTNVTNWNGIVSDWNDVFEIDSNGNLKVKVNLYGQGEISAYGSGATGGNTDINLGNYYTKDQIDGMFDTLGGNVDIDLSNYYTKTETTNLLKDKSDSGHTHNYASTVKVGSTAYNVSGNTISLPAYPTLSSLSGVANNTFTAHTASTVHITSTERTNWNAAYNNNHTHSNKSVIDGISSTNVSNWNTAFNNNHSHTNKTQLDTITSTKITNWDKVVSDWDKIFSINSDGSLKVKVNLYGDGEVSAFGSGATSTDINLGNYYTKDQIDGMFDTMGGGGNVDLSDYYTKTETDTKLNSYATTTSLNNHTGSTSSHVSTTDRNYWNAKSDAHSHPYASTVKLGSTSYNVSGNTISLPAYPTLSSLGGVANNTFTAHTASTVHITADERKTWNAKSDAHTHPYATTTNFNSHSGNTTLHITAAERNTWNAKSNAHSHPYAGSSTQGGAATSANKLNTNGGSATQPVYFSNGVPVTCTTYANASVNYANSAGSATNATTASKLSTVSKTAWGQTFWTSGGIPTSISGNMTGVGSITASGNITTSAEVTAHSDIRLKTNIQPLTNRGYITPTTYIKDGKESIGFIAQDMQKLYPELVIVDESTEEKYLTVNYMQYTAVLQAQIIELQEQLDSLWKIIKENDIYNKE